MPPPVPATIGSLCSGIGGLELGLERAWGARTLWQVEKSDYGRKVLARHWPDAARFVDVREVDARELAPVDCICAGFPCQPHSVAGSRRGRDDERWLWPAILHVVRELRPSWIVLENVPGLLSSDEGAAFGQVLADLAACGFAATWSVLSAGDVGELEGRPAQKRQRVFVVAWRE
jgi:DNA (cytosine-5)-methyltransferase 1